MELETYKLRCKTLQEENRDLRKASVTIVSTKYMLVWVTLGIFALLSVFVRIQNCTFPPAS